MFDCNFDTDFCMWTQDSTDTFDWDRSNGPTPTDDTGPTADHTSGFPTYGHYAYIETSRPRQPKDTARLLSPLTDKSTKCLTFWFMMHGDDVADLNVYTRSGPSQPLGTPVFTRSGPSNQSIWVQANLTISSTADFQVVIEATRGESYFGDIAIDDISYVYEPCFVDFDLTIQAPPGHVIMISFPYGDIWGCLTLKTNATLLLFECVEHPSPYVHATAYLEVRRNKTCKTSWWSLRDYCNPSDTPFNVRYTFHSIESQPRQLASGLWNCSGPDWPDFERHLQCNYRVECRDGRDEADCAYSSERCEGAGLVPVGGACLFLPPRQNHALSWIDASAECARRGGRLAALKTRRQRTQAAEVMHLDAFPNSLVYLGMVGFTTAPYAWYRDTVRWTDGTIFHHWKSASSPGGGRRHGKGGHYGSHWGTSNEPVHIVELVNFKKKKSAVPLCEALPNDTAPATRTVPTLALLNRTFGVPTVTCPAGHRTHQFLACDAHTSCWSRDEEAGTCGAPLTPLPPFLACASLGERVPYTLVCDHRPDCTDHSDEDFCRFPECENAWLSCGDGQCFTDNTRCNSVVDCKSELELDEQHCPDDIFKYDSGNDRPYFEPPAALMLLVKQTPMLLYARRKSPLTCPDTHFKCLSQDYCLPVFMRCNGLKDCLDHEDEADCHAYTCRGFYRCRQSQVCLHPRHLCDGFPHCPQHDDEVMCDVTCPLHCQCRGMAFFCAAPFPVQSFPQLRYLDAVGSNLTAAEVTGTPLLVFLTLARCGLTRLHDLNLPNLLFLDVSYNLLTSLSASIFVNVPQVRNVSLAFNPFLRLVDSGQHLHLTKLDLSGVPMPRLNASVLAAFPNLQRLNLSGSGVTRVGDEGFQRLTQLREVDLRGCPVNHVPALMFQSAERLTKVYADSFRLCCPVLLPPGFKVHECEAPEDELSSCDDLLGSSAYTILLFVFALLALVGNGTSFLFRTCVSRSKSKLGFGVFVTHLSVSDFLMGVYLLIIGVADRTYTGRYLWNDFAWRHSAACKVAGFLSLLSSEVSALTMCLITVDRFLVLRFPFSRWHFGPTSAHMAALVVWVTGLVLVSVPLLPVTSHWEFYSQTGICVPLPITRKDFAGRVFSFSVVIVFNFVLFFFICCGQLVIYWSVRAGAISVTSTNRKSKDLTIARRLITVAMSDFLCWFPIGVLGLLASRGVPIRGEVNVAVAVLVMPINSALNPFLYTLNVLMERRRLAREEQLRKHILAQLKAAAD